MDTENHKWESELINVAKPLQAIDSKAKRKIYDDSSHYYRNNFQRDRDRILYSTAFRRLSGKTQVFNVGIGDHYRNRLTHTLEVTQIATTISKFLGLNVELTEAIALGHDIGHTPFGHVGERALNHIMNNCEILDKFGVKLRKGQKGFKHNLQALRVLCNIEKKSRDYNGIDITYNTLWGIINHTSKEFKECEKIKDGYCLMRRDSQRVKCINENDGLALLNLDFYDQYIKEIPADSWSFEAYIVKNADEIAQRHNDIDDGIIADIFELESFTDEFEKAFQGTSCYQSDVKRDLENLKVEKDNEYLLPLLSRFIITFYVTNYIKSVEENLKENIINKYSIKNSNDFYENKNRIWEDNKNNLNDWMQFNNEFRKSDEKVKELLKKRITNSQEAQLMDGKGTFIVRKLFEAYLNTPNQLPDDVITKIFTDYERPEKTTYRSKYDIGGLRGELDTKIKDNTFLLHLCRNICDYIAGMTDSYALKQYEKLYGYNTLPIK